MRHLITTILLLLFVGCTNNPNDYSKRPLRDEADISAYPSQSEQLELTSTASGMMLLYRSPSLPNVRKAVNIGTIRSNKALDESQYGNKLLGFLKTYVSDHQKMLKEVEARLRTEEAALKQLPPQTDDWKSGVKIFKNHIGQYELQAKVFNEELTKVQQELIDKFHLILQRAARSVAVQMGLDIVIDAMESPQIRKTLTPLALELLKRPLEDITSKVILEIDAYKFD